MAMLAFSLLPTCFFSLLGTSTAGVDMCSTVCRSNECCNIAAVQPACVVMNTTEAASFGSTAVSPFSTQKNCNRPPTSESTMTMVAIVSVSCVVGALVALYGLYVCASRCGRGGAPQDFWGTGKVRTRGLGSEEQEDGDEDEEEEYYDEEEDGEE